MALSMNRFNKRLSKGQKLQQFLIDYLDKHQISYFLTGYEGLSQKHNAKIKIIRNDSPTSMFVRHYPDITLASNKDTFLLEIKNSSGIEKECWDAYKSLHDNLGINILFLLKTKKIYPLKSIKFNRMSSFDRRSGLHIPVTSEVWREPRKMNELDYKKYLKSYNGSTSGCSFAFIDFKNSKGYEIENLLRLL